MVAVLATIIELVAIILISRCAQPCGGHRHHHHHHHSSDAPALIIIACRYMAPEVFRHEPYNDRVDIYALSMLMYYFCHGHPPFDGLPPVESACAAALEGRRPLVSAPIRSGCPPIVKLMEQCWDPIPGNRPSARECCGILELMKKDFLDGAGDSADVDGIFSTGGRGVGGAVRSPSWFARRLVAAEGSGWGEEEDRAAAGLCNCKCAVQ